MLDIYIGISVSLVLAVFFATRDVVYLFFSSCYILIYMLDALVSIERGALYMSPSTPFINVAKSSFEQASSMVFISFVIYSIMFLAFRVFRQFLDVNLNLIVDRSEVVYFFGNQKAFLPNGVRLLTLITLVFFPLFSALFALSEVSFSNPLQLLTVMMSNRGLIFSENLLATVTLYILPGSAIIAFYICFYTCQSKRYQRSIFFVAFVFLSILCVLTGSRSAFIFNLFIPLMVFWLYKGRFIITKITKKHIAMVFMIPFAFISIVQISNVYRDATRGAQNEESFLVSPDVVQFDALSIIIDNGFSGYNTYLSAFTFLIPRSYWDNKPVSGNRIFSEKLYGERLENTGAEMTSSLLGEAYINFASAGVISASLILFLLTAYTSKLLSSSDEIFRLLGLVFLFRGVNVIRGDLLNAVVPLFFTYIIFRIVNNILSRRKVEL